MSSRLDIPMNRKADFAAEFQYVNEDGTPISLVGKTLKFIAKESDTSTIDTYNENVTITDAVRGMFAIYKDKEFTNIPTMLIYDIFCLEDDERIVYGQIIPIGAYY
jgi:hypothetical protein